MNEEKYVCPFLSAGNKDEFEYCIGSDCAIWCFDQSDHDYYGLCGLACSGISHGLMPQAFRDPVMPLKRKDK